MTDIATLGGVFLSAALAAPAVLLGALIARRAWCHRRAGQQPPEPHPETQDDFAPAAARWGWLADRREGPEA